MTGYQSKKAAAQDKLEQAAFDAWWDTRPRVNKTNPCSVDSFEYWAWEGWHAALAQPEQEPVAWMYDWFCDGKLITGWIAHSEPEIPKSMALNIRPLYITPPQRTWVGLTDEEFQLIYDMGRTPTGMMEMVEDKLKEKNMDSREEYYKKWDDLYVVYLNGVYDGKKAALAGREQNFCERCGKRTADLTTIHTCTPPKENT